MSTFTLDLQAFTKKAGANADLVVKRVVAGMAESVIEMSPVGDGVYWKSPPPKGYVGGRFRGNWDYGFNAAPKQQFDVVDKTGAMSMGRVLMGLSAAPTAGIHYIANNLPYAERLENGWSRQAPVGMVGVTVGPISTTYEAGSKVSVTYSEIDAMLRPFLGAVKGQLKMVRA